jgi:hypothetical protein
MLYHDITEVFEEVIQQTGSIDVAESEFKKMIGEDDELRQLYREWCQEVGSTERNGFSDFCDEYLELRNAVWDSLDNDYDR